MGLGKKLLRSLFNSGSKRHGRRRRAKDLGPLATIGTVAATAMIINAVAKKKGGDGVTGKDFLFDDVPVSQPSEKMKARLNAAPVKKGPVKIEPPVSRDPEDIRREEAAKFARETEEQIRKQREEDYTYTQLGKLSLCWYIASCDNDVTAEERKDLYELMKHIDADPQIPSKFKSGIYTSICNPEQAFSTAKKYLEHADPADLIEMVEQAYQIAAIDGVSEREQYALDAFKFFVEQQTGHHFDDLKLRKIDPTCPSCGAMMKIAPNNSKGICAHCGYTRIFFPV
ncbi:MAG: hypothetical protein J5685_00860 [Clostridiales bacterium]|nr:hypothetical protein [Clostridiales bacterium]